MHFIFGNVIWPVTFMIYSRRDSFLASVEMAVGINFFSILFVKYKIMYLLPFKYWCNLALGINVFLGYL